MQNFTLQPMNYLEIETLSIPLEGIDLKPIDYMSLELNPKRINTLIISEKPSKSEAFTKMIKSINSCDFVKQVNVMEQFLANSHFFTNGEKETLFLVIDNRLEEIAKKNEKF